MSRNLSINSSSTNKLIFKRVIPVDNDALIYINELELTVTLTVTQKTAINQLFLDLKGQGDTTNNNNIYSKFTAIYPFIGSTSTTHSINAINIGTYDITWNGGMTHDGNGITGNGIDGEGSTGISPYQDLILNNTHLSIYSRSNFSEQSFDIGVLQNPLYFGIYLNYDGTMYQRCYSTSTQIVESTSVSDGHFIVNRISSTSHIHYRNGTNLYNNTIENTDDMPTIPITIGAAGNALFSSRNYSFASIGEGFESGEAVDCYDAIQKLQVSLNRNV